MKKNFFPKIIITIVIALLAPIFSYTVFQFSQRNQDEALIKTIYDRQLSSILFSVNQYCWDMFHSWHSEVSTIITTQSHAENETQSNNQLQQFINRNPSIIGLVIQKPNNKRTVFWKQEDQSQSIPLKKPASFNRLDEMLAQSESRIDRMIRQAQGGYVRPLRLPWIEGPRNGVSVLVIPVLHQENPDDVTLVSFFMYDLEFANRIIADKFREMEEDEGHFVFAVIHRRTGSILHTNIEERTGSFEKRDPLWILPNLDLSIKMTGTTLDEISGTRAKQNLIFIILVNIILIIGISYLLVNIFKEISLAQMKTDFVANVSHELRTPLALIRMHAETLEMGRVTSQEKKQRYYHTIMNESARLTQLINNILDFSHIESKKKSYRQVPADLSILTEETLTMYNYRFEQTGFIIERNIVHDLPVIYVDKESVTQVLVNLLDNAIKFSTDRKEIVVSVYKKERFLVLSVQDFGIGIPESEHKKIFDKFYRVGNSLVHNTKGSGLGLSLVKHIMDFHRGSITVKSKPGEGSTFILWFPLNE